MGSVKELLYLKSLIVKLTNYGVKNIKLNVDNQRTMSLIKNGEALETYQQHIVLYYFLNVKVHESVINITDRSQVNQAGNIFIKLLENAV